MPLRPVSNPPARFQAARTEWWWEPPAPAEVQVYEDATKAILSRNDSPDLPFRWSLNPYRGCQHACSYCFARPSHEYWGFGAGTDFETKLMVKPDAPELLRAAFMKPSWKGERVVLSGNTDCYQPLEARWGLTRRCLEVFREFKNPVGIITKSPLILRDLDVLKDLHREAALHVVVSIPFSDEAMARKVDAGAPSLRRRFLAVEALSRAGLFVTVSLAPVIPGLNDSQAPEILKRAREAGARGAFLTLLRLADTGVPVFLERLRRDFPLAAGKVESFLRSTRGGILEEKRCGHRHVGQGNRWDLFARQFGIWQRKLGLDQAHPLPPAPTFHRPGPRQEVFPFQPLQSTSANVSR